RTADEGLRSGVGARPARRRAHRVPSRLTHRLPAAPERRLRARRLPPASAARALRIGQMDRRGRVRPSPQDARELARAGGRRPARPGAGGARRPRPPGRRARRGAGARRVRRARPRARRLIENCPMSERLAHAKINLALVVGPVLPNGKHEVTTVLQRVELADRIVLEPASTEAGGGRAWRATIDKRIPVAAGLGGGSSDAAAALALANATLDRPLSGERLHELGARLGADVPFFLADGPCLGEGDGSALTALDLPRGYVVVLFLPDGVSKPSTASVYARFDARGGA